MLGLTCLGRRLNVEGILAGIPARCTGAAIPPGTTPGALQASLQASHCFISAGRRHLSTADRHPSTAAHLHTAAGTTTGWCFAAFEPDGGRQMRKAGLLRGQTQAVQVTDHTQVRKGSRMEKQQPQRASNNCWRKRGILKVSCRLLGQVLRNF